MTIYQKITEMELQ